jgi:glycosyltransferase involved in cell wall biosynthesis
MGPPVLLWLNTWLWKKPVIYDFDDAIWLRDETGESRLVSAIKWKRKVGTICSWAAVTNAGNSFLADYSRSHSGNPSVIPTVVDTTNHHKRRRPLGKSLIIGWTGSHSTLPFLEPVIPVLRGLCDKYAFEFRIIANRDPGYPDEFIKFVPWNKDNEIADLEEFHIGLMPLPDTEWSKGKCGFKAIQYLSLEIPAVVSPVGVNTEVVHHGIHGFCARTTEEWYDFLERLITSPDLRKEMGSRGRAHIVENYSVKATEQPFLELFR